VSLAMTKQERETLLADLHVGIISIPEEGRGPLTVPIWYSSEPGGELRVVTARTSRKAQLFQHAGRFSVCVQTETEPYKYVSVGIHWALADIRRNLLSGAASSPSTVRRTSRPGSSSVLVRQDEQAAPRALRFFPWL
jgi:hypothetical protein